MLHRSSWIETVSSIAAASRTKQPTVERRLSKAPALGISAALQDLPGRGRGPSITDDDKTQVVSLAGQKPKELGYAQKLWATRLLAQHAWRHCVEAGTRICRKPR